METNDNDIEQAEPKKCYACGYPEDARGLCQRCNNEEDWWEFQGMRA